MAPFRLIAIAAAFDNDNLWAYRFQLLPARQLIANQCIALGMLSVVVAFPVAREAFRSMKSGDVGWSLPLVSMALATLGFGLASVSAMVVGGLERWASRIFVQRFLSGNRRLENIAALIVAVATFPFLLNADWFVGILALALALALAPAIALSLGSSKGRYSHWRGEPARQTAWLSSHGWRRCWWAFITLVPLVVAGCLIYGAAKLSSLVVDPTSALMAICVTLFVMAAVPILVFAVGDTLSPTGLVSRGSADIATRDDLDYVKTGAQLIEADTWRGRTCRLVALLLLDTLSPQDRRSRSIAEINPNRNNRETALGVLACNLVIAGGPLKKSHFLLAAAYPLVTGVVLLIAFAVADIADTPTMLMVALTWLVISVTYLSLECHGWVDAMRLDERLCAQLRPIFAPSAAFRGTLLLAREWYAKEIDKIVAIVIGTLFLAMLAVLMGLELRYAGRTQKNWDFMVEQIEEAETQVDTVRKDTSAAPEEGQ